MQKSQVIEWGASVIDPIIPAENGKPGRRCDAVYFPVYDQVELTEFSILVKSIWAIPREGQMCDRIDEVTKTLSVKGIKVSCQMQEWGGGFQIISKPETMSEEEAYTLLSDVVNRTIKGPWEFSVRLK